jgi:hypothetical protein
VLRSGQAAQRHRIQEKNHEETKDTKGSASYQSAASSFSSFLRGFIFADERTELISLIRCFYL